MKLAALFLPLSLLFMATYANAASVALTEDDCKEIMERYAADPESVPQHLLDACKEMLSTVVPARYEKPTADPCADSAAADSVQCWGPWSALKPVAGGFQPTKLAAIDEIDTRPELAGPFEAKFGCAAGTACGFATVAPGLVAQPADTTASTIVPFLLAFDGSNFRVNPDGSVSTVAEVTSMDGLHSPGFSDSRFQGSDGETASLIIANLNNAANGDISDATGIWRHGSVNNQDDSNTSAGVFAWGVASTVKTLTDLNRDGITATFNGTMAGDTRTRVSMIVNFGSQPAWSGNWHNTARDFDFDANGSIRGANLISNGFSDNVMPTGSYVQGVLQGAEGNQSVAHAINIILKDRPNIIIKDVGTLR